MTRHIGELTVPPPAQEGALAFNRNDFYRVWQTG